MAIPEFLASFGRYFEEELDRRDKIRMELRNLDKVVRDIQVIFNQIHSLGANATEICNNGMKLFPQLLNSYVELSKIVPASQLYKYNDMWRWSNQQVCFFAILCHFLQNFDHQPQTYCPISLEQIEKLIGIDRIPDFHFDLEDYLHGLISLPSELSRLCVNAVTHGDFQKPIQVGEFVSNLYDGFRLLNLKNDSLRKRFDSIKYDVKKIEEIRYDISIRGLDKKPAH